MTNSDRLQEIRERAEKATEGPWACWDGWGPISGGYLEGLMAMARIGPSGGRSQEVLSASDGTQRDIYAKRQDAEFIAASREDIPYLLQLVTEQQNEIAWLRTWIFRLHGPEVAAQKIHQLTEEPMTIDQIKEFLGIDPGSAFGTPGTAD